MGLKTIRILVLITAFILSFWALVISFDLPKWFPFNTDSALDEWQEKIFKGRVLYEVEPKQEGGYLSAQSDKTCSGLIYRIKFRPKDNPMISWRWKVVKFPEKSEEALDKSGWIEKDDYAARVYVIFPSWNIFDIQSIEYIWAEDLPDGILIESPYFGNLKLFVVESGKDNIGQWVFEERNIYKDYEQAFGRFPGRWVGAIALMTDADNTISTAEAMYKDLKVGYVK